MNWGLGWKLVKISLIYILNLHNTLKPSVYYFCLVWTAYSEKGTNFLIMEDIINYILELIFQDEEG